MPPRPPRGIRPWTGWRDEEGGGEAPVAVLETRAEIPQEAAPYLGTSGTLHVSGGQSLSLGRETDSTQPRAGPGGSAPGPAMPWSLRESSRVRRSWGPGARPVDGGLSRAQKPWTRGRAWELGAQVRPRVVTTASGRHPPMGRRSRDQEAGAGTAPVGPGTPPGGGLAMSPPPSQLWEPRSPPLTSTATFPAAPSAGSRDPHRHCHPG